MIPISISFFLGFSKEESNRRQAALKAPQENEVVAKEATLSPATAKEIYVNAYVMAVLWELDDILKRPHYLWVVYQMEMSQKILYEVPG